MKKKKPFYFFAPAFALLLLTFSFELAVASTDPKEEQLAAARELDQNTLAAPLLLSQAAEPWDLPQGTSLLSQPYKIGYEGGLDYQKIADQAYRLRYQDLKKQASFFFLFDKSLDLRDRWVRLRYSGLNAPRRLSLEIDPDELRTDGRLDLYLSASPSIESVYFKLPDKVPYGELDSLHFLILPEDLQSEDGDFLILGLELLPQGGGPLDQAPPSDLSRFDGYSNPFEAENKTPVNSQYSF